MISGRLFRLRPARISLKIPTAAVSFRVAYVKWSQWLADNIPGTRRRIELQNARIFFPEERCTEFNRELRAHWQSAQREAQ